MMVVRWGEHSGIVVGFVSEASHVRAIIVEGAKIVAVPIAILTWIRWVDNEGN